MTNTANSWRQELRFQAGQSFDREGEIIMEEYLKLEDMITSLLTDARAEERNRLEVYECKHANEERKKIFTDLLAIADRGEYEELRREVEIYKQLQALTKTI